MTQVVEDTLLTFKSDGGTVINLPTVKGVKYGEGQTLEQGLVAMNAQIVQSASGLAGMQAQLADIIAWLSVNFDYQPQPQTAPDSYLTPLFAEMMQVPGVQPDPSPEQEVDHG